MGLERKKPKKIIPTGGFEPPAPWSDGCLHWSHACIYTCSTTELVGHFVWKRIIFLSIMFGVWCKSLVHFHELSVYFYVAVDVTLCEPPSEEPSQSATLSKLSAYHDHANYLRGVIKCSHVWAYDHE